MSFIFAKYVLELCASINSETQDGKGLAVIHFSTATGFKYRYIELLSLNVMTPVDLVHAVRHRESMSLFIVDVFEFDNEKDQYSVWHEEAKKRGVRTHLSSHERENEMR